MNDTTIPIDWYLEDHKGDWPAQKAYILAASFGPLIAEIADNPDSEDEHPWNTISDLRSACGCGYITNEQFAEVAPYVNAKIAATAAEYGLPVR